MKQNKPLKEMCEVSVTHNLRVSCTCTQCLSLTQVCGLNSWLFNEVNNVYKMIPPAPFKDNYFHTLAHHLLWACPAASTVIELGNVQGLEN